MFHDSQAVLALSREENPTTFQKTLGLNDFYFGSDDFEFPLGNIQMVGKSQAPMFRGEKPGETKLAPRVDAGAGRQARDRLLALDRGPAAAGEPRHASTATASSRSATRRRTTSRRAAVPQAQVAARPARHEPGPPDPPVRVHEERDPGRRLRAPGGHLPVRRRPGDSVAERRLPRARARQPLRRRHQHLPEHRRGEPGADGDGERAPGRRPPARADGLRRRAATSRERLPSGEQIEIASRRPARWSSSRSAAGCARTPSAAATCSTAMRPTRCATSGRGQVLDARGRTGSRTAATSSTDAAHQLPLPSPNRNAIHGLVRWSAWTVGERAPDRVVMAHVLHPQPGYPFSLALRIEYALSDAGLTVRHDGDERRRRAVPVRLRRAPVPDRRARRRSIASILRVPARTRAATRTSAACRRHGAGRRHGVRLPRAAADRRDAARPLLHRPGAGRRRAGAASSCATRPAAPRSRSGWTRPTRYLMVFTRRHAAATSPGAASRSSR